MPNAQIAALLVLAALPGCADDPIYVAPPAAIEVGADGMTFTGTGTVTLPIRLETADEAMDRAALSAALGVAVPFITTGDLDLEIEWSLRNLSNEPAEVRIQINGANELFAYEPLAFVIDPEEDEAPPPLMGDVPYELEALAEQGGVFREDQLAEACLDLELITRGALSPFTALLVVDEDRPDFPDAGGAAVPPAAWASMVRFDLTLIADRHVVLEYTVRARDHRDPKLLHPMLFDAPAGELVAFNPAAYQPPPPPAP